MSLTDYPIETSEPTYNVMLGIGTHVLKLTVKDDAGLESAPDKVVISVKRIPSPSIASISPEVFFKGVTVDAVIHGAQLKDVTTIKVFRDAQEDDRVVVTMREEGDDDRLPITIAVSDHAHAGPRTLVVTSPGGAATVALKVLSAAGSKIRAITPARGQVGLTHPIAVRVNGDNLEGAADVAFLYQGQPDELVHTIVRSAQPDYVDSDVSISVNAPFGRRTFTVTTPTNEAQSPPGVSFTVVPGLLQYGIMLLTLIAAFVHISLQFPNALYIFNGLGYIALLTLLYAPLGGQVARLRPGMRWVLVAYALLTIVSWVAMGPRTNLAYATKLVEAALIVLLILESRRP